MFLSTVFICLGGGLFLTSGAALHMGIFKSHRKEKSLISKAFTGILSYGLSAVFWFFSYSYHYLGW